MNAFGQLSGSCIVCLTGTDTALAFAGSLEWKAAALVVLGVPQREAIATVDQFVDGSDRAAVTIRVCASCVRNSRANFPEPALVYVGGEVPCIQEAGR